MSNHSGTHDRTRAQYAANRIRVLREELSSADLEAVLALTAEQRRRFDEWSLARLTALSEQFDVDTSASQERISWGMRIASTLGAIALCAAVVFCFIRYWGYLDTWVQVTVVILTPLLSLAALECVARRERTGYFTGLLSLVSLTSFIMNLVVIDNIFNIVSNERSLLAGGALALVLAYRYRLPVMLALGLLFEINYVAAFYTSAVGYSWLDCWYRPEHFLLLGVAVFSIPFFLRHPTRAAFPAVYRFIGALTTLIAVLSLAASGSGSYLPWTTENVQRFYELTGLCVSAAAIWLGILRNWSAIVNIGACFFTLFLLMRLYHWWWDWMPRYLFFAAIGTLGIGLVFLFKRLRSQFVRPADEVPA